MRVQLTHIDSWKASYRSTKESCLRKKDIPVIGKNKFLCVKCGHKENADINAAKNILAVGLAVLACGEEALATSMNQEPLDMGDLVLA